MANNGPIPWSRVGAGAVALLIALLSYLAAETRGDVRDLQQSAAIRVEQLSDLRGELRAVRAIVERIERKVGP